MRPALALLALTAVVLAWALAGCAVGSDFRRPDLGIEVPGRYQQAGAEEALPEPPSVYDDRWWRVFGDPDLDRLVEEAVAHNWDVKKAAAAVLEVEALFRQARADRFPQANIKGQAVRAQQTVSVTTLGDIQLGPGGRIFMGPPETVHTTETAWSYSLSAPVSFELDLFGRLARADEAARAELLRVEESRLTVVQSVIAQTVTLYLEIEALERRLALAEGNVETCRRALAVVEGRYERGLGDVLAVRQARRALAQAEAVLPGLRQDLGLAQQELAVLLGRYPETGLPRPQPEDYFHKLEPVPPGLPSELLLRRPDVRAAEAALRAANARIGLAKAARFPSFSLTASFGYASNELSELFWPTSRLFSAGLGLLAPLFNAGKLKAAQNAAEARYEQVLADYARTVLGAFSEVEGALLRRRELLERRERTLALVEEARATETAAGARYERGLVGYLDVLEAGQARYSAEDGLILAELAVYSNQVGLHRALGGGWGGTGSAGTGGPAVGEGGGD
ncbi:MAG: efflux transporter outer membrane subunit [Thermodesulfobacteriota bacterium]